MTTSRWRLLGCALLTIPLCGCLDEQLELHVQPDGAAKLEVRCTIERSLDLLGMFGAQTSSEELAAGMAASYLNSFEGVSAWTDVKVSEVEGKTRCEATGWVPDLGKLARRASGGDERVLRRWSLTRSEGWLEAKLEGMGERFTAPYTLEEVLDGTPEQLEGLRRAVLTTAGTLRLFKQEPTSTVRLSLPGPPLAHSGWSAVEGARLTLESSPAWARAEHQRLHDALRSVQRRCASGELTREAASAEVEQLRARAGVPRARWTAGSASPEFTAALQQAVTSWPTSPWKQALAEAEEERLRQAERRAEREAEEAEQRAREAAMPDDAFEPNDSLRSAAVLEPGLYEGLTLKDDDCYQITIPANQELRISLRAEGDYGALMPEVYAGKDRPLELEFDRRAGAEVARCAVRRETTLRLELSKLGAACTYSIELTLTPFEPADPYEPNDLVNQARKLKPGEHANLVLSGGADWYAFDCPADQVARVSLTTADDAHALPFELRTWDGDAYAVVAHGSSTDGSLRCRAVKGRVVIRVYGDHAVQGAAYTLKLESSAEPSADAFEPNNQERRKRPPLAPGTYEGLWADPVDHYRVEVPAGRTLRVRAVASAEAVELECSLRLKGEYMTLLERSGREVELEYTAPAGGAALELRVEASQLRRYRLTVALDDGTPGSTPR